MNTYKLLALASILFPSLMHAMHGTPQKHDSRASKRAKEFEDSKKRKERKIMRVQNAVSFNCTRKSNQTSTHIIEIPDFKLPAAARGNA